MRCFHQWRPGSSFTPVPLKLLDLQSEYVARLKSAVAANLPILSARFKTSPNKIEITHRLLSQNSDELRSVRHRRAEVLKNSQNFAPSEEYASFLRQLYAPKISEDKLEAALGALPDLSQLGQAFYIQPSHLETLVNRSSEFPRLFKLVHDLMEKAELPLTAREKATYVFSVFKLGGNWKSALAHFWPSILESNDTGALNQLLKLALVARCKDTQSLIQYHAKAKSNRFTHLLRLRYQDDSPNLPVEIMREIQAKNFVVDTVLISSYISGLLRVGRPDGITAAENVFKNLVATCAGTNPVKVNPNRLANCLTALDTICQITQSRIDVPLYIDSPLFERMYIHYCSRNMDDAALNVLTLMAKQDCILPRHLITSHLHRTTSIDLIKSLFDLCFDFNLAHPGFVSETFARTWIKVLTVKCEMDYEDALEFVSRSRAAQNVQYWTV